MSAHHQVGDGLMVGETLTADTDGIRGRRRCLAVAVYSYQWLADDADIAGATSDTYTPVCRRRWRIVRSR